MARMARSVERNSGIFAARISATNSSASAIGSPSMVKATGFRVARKYGITNFIRSACWESVPGKSETTSTPARGSSSRSLTTVPQASGTRKGSVAMSNGLSVGI